MTSQRNPKQHFEKKKQNEILTDTLAETLNWKPKETLNETLNWNPKWNPKWNPNWNPKETPNDTLNNNLIETLKEPTWMFKNRETKSW